MKNKRVFLNEIKQAVQNNTTNESYELLNSYVNFINSKLENNIESNAIVGNLDKEWFSQVIFEGIKHTSYFVEVTYNKKVFINKKIAHTLQEVLKEIIKKVDVKKLSSEFPRMINTKEHFVKVPNVSKRPLDDLFVVNTWNDSNSKIKLIKTISERYKLNITIRRVFK